MPIDSKLRAKIRRIALVNAIKHKGEAKLGPVLGKIMGESPDLRENIHVVSSIIREIIEEVNNLTLEEKRQIVEKNWPEALIQEKTIEQKDLPPLPNLDKYDEIVTRFSPNPDAPIHLGSARAIILCHEYAKRHKGRFLVRFEDTDPKLKKPELQFYESIKEDLEWLECKPNEYFIQSDRILIYYKHAEELLKLGQAYICTCTSEVFKRLISAKKPCPCRNLPPEKQMNRWKMMLNGTYGEGEAVVRVKTDLKHPNPAVRDWPALRIINTEEHRHPRVGSKFRVWPLYNLACGVDDHLLGVTHIIRGKEHLTNQTRQEFMYKYLGWSYPEAFHYGRLKISGASLSKSKIVQGVRSGLYDGWDDPRLATFKALKRRGIQPGALRKLMMDIGPKSQDVTISWENLYSQNRKIVETLASRFFFVHNPRRLIVRSVQSTFNPKIPLHPNQPNRGFRQFQIEPKKNQVEFWITQNDLEKVKKCQLIRLMELFNVEIDRLRDNVLQANFHSEEYEKARKVNAPLIHWLPLDETKKCRVQMPDASFAEGFVEGNSKTLKANTVVQFERFGFVRVENNSANELTAIFTHR